jgi:plasmid stabilization system protein ParE
MARIEFGADVFDDFERFRRHLHEHDIPPAEIAARIRALMNAIRVLETSPEVGRPVRAGARELVVGSGSSGYVVLYRYAPELRLVLILAARHQRERGFKRRRG